ncbi:GAG-pre-integrase domain-containing protein, partial [Aeromonas veronii]|uniref:GAG-pre-integrase domain-containing protein n=1 Tax=Aeromonas veronii TaxID=654 RepID=UPI00406CACDE
NYRNLENLAKNECVRGLPKIKLSENSVCGDCLKGKQTRVPHPSVQHDGQQGGSTHCFQLLHMDLMGPIEVDSLSGMRYSFVIVDDFSRY